ncbi:MAG TPA: histidine kinase dimerization/phospho-acceptor domain-containing protein [Lachnospiraceae bacterium]|nr:histidine kinase dimerization/phospho-acceptor domain-containing protein [Lachnospiraceae bacterium]
MDTKWKRCKNKFGLALFILGLSSVIMSIAAAARQISMSYSLLGNIQFGSQNDYQKLRTFQDGINEKLDICLTIANETFVDWSYYDEYSYPEYTEDYAAEYSDMTPEEMEAYLEQNRFYNSYDNIDNFSSEEKAQMAESYLSYWKNDLNMLYQITVDGKVKYANMENTFFYGDTLPEGYNYIMHFDGEKVQIIKDGKEMDVYGNGIYYSGGEYAVPGYSNFKADSSLENVTVTLIAIQTPLEYRIAGSKNESCYYGNTFYLNHDMQNLNSGWQKVFLFVIAGIFLLIPAIIMRRGFHSYREKLADFLNNIWIEAKLLLVILVASVAMHSGMVSSFGYTYAYEFGYYMYNSGSFISAIITIIQNLFFELFDNPLWFLTFFWIMYFVIFDIVHNHKKKQNGLLLKLIRSFNDRNLKLNFSKRQVRRVSVLLLCTVIALILFGMGMIMFAYGSDESSLIFPIIGLVLLFVSFFWYCRTMRSQAADLDMLNDQIEKISRGNYDPQKMPFSGNDFQKTEQNLLQIQSGIKNAVDDQLRSERMKVDLVANVSHDLKTPLTSIISYVQFLKEEDTLPDHVKDYIRILDEKSARLGEMVQDVFSISKATSGQLPVQMEVLDFGKLLNQTLADMEETISKCSISIKSDIQEHEYFIEADGQRMYRVCQNLIQNALKYSLEGSRMFISLKQVKEQAVATFMNTSKAELDQGTDFVARFVRGDSSRTDGGSGLGLSIAKSFTEACGGDFTIEVNGDTFVVTISFEQKSAS